MKFFNILLVCGFFLLLTGCSGGGKKTLTIGVDESYPPFSFKKGQEAAGFDVDLISAIAEEIGYKADFKLMAFEQTLKDLEEGKIDIAAGGLTMTKERAERFLFSNGYYSPNFCMIFKKTKLGNDFLKIQDITPGSKIGLQKGTVMMSFLENLLKEKPELSFVLKEYNGNFEMIDALKTGEINFFITEDLQAELLTQTSQGLGYFIINSDESGEKESYALAFNKKNKKLAKLVGTELKNLEESGKIEILKLRWFSSYGIYDNISK